jgi:hypothetical protein
MLPLPPAVVKCRDCEECYWLAEAEEVGTIEVWRDRPQQAKAWATAKEVQEPTEEEYYRAIEKGLAKSPEQERDLRVLAWWRRNDAFRGKRKARAAGTPSSPGSWRANLEALALLLDDGDENDTLMKAEVLRELGRFESAKQILSRVESAELTTVVSQLQSLCDRSDTHVRELRFAD